LQVGARASNSDAGDCVDAVVYAVAGADEGAAGVHAHAGAVAMLGMGKGADEEAGASVMWTQVHKRSFLPHFEPSPKVSQMHHIRGASMVQVDA
jgi:hypothetical protein